MNKLKKGVGTAASELSRGRTASRKVARKASRWVTKTAMPQRRQPSKAVMALKGLGAAVMALPIGYWLGRKVFGR